MHWPRRGQGLRLVDPRGASVKNVQGSGFTQRITPSATRSKFTTYYYADMTKVSRQLQTGYSSYGAYSGPQQNSTKQFTNRNVTPSTKHLHNAHLGKSSFSAEGRAQAEGRKHASNKMQPKLSTGETTPIGPYMFGRLRARVSFWKTFIRSTTVLSWIVSGLPLFCQNGIAPPSAEFKNHASVFSHAEFVTAAIQDLVNAGSAIPVATRPYIVAPLGVVPKKGSAKFRLIYDARFVNSYLLVPKFKFEDLGNIGDVLQQNDWIITHDLTKGYHHLDMNENFWGHLGFEWKGQYYVYRSLPFGLASAPWAFTKLTKELYGKWRKMGHRCTGYIDDGVHGDQSRDALLEKRDHVLIPDLENCGFVVNREKSILEPQQEAPYLGVILDTIGARMFLPEERKERILTLVKTVLQYRRSCAFYLVEKLAGNLISVSWAFGPIARLMTMSLYNDLNRARLEGSQIYLSQTVVDDLSFWLWGITAFNGYRRWVVPFTDHITMSTDAAGASPESWGGWAGWTDYRGEVQIARGHWQTWGIG